VRFLPAGPALSLRFEVNGHDILVVNPLAQQSRLGANVLNIVMPVEAFLHFPTNGPGGAVAVWKSEEDDAGGQCGIQSLGRGSVNMNLDSRIEHIGLDLLAPMRADFKSLEADRLPLRFQSSGLSIRRAGLKNGDAEQE
jgi:hypothetical protein